MTAVVGQNPYDTVSPEGPHLINSIEFTEEQSKVHT